MEHVFLDQFGIFGDPATTIETFPMGVFLCKSECLHVSAAKFQNVFQHEDPKEKYTSSKANCIFKIAVRILIF